MKSKNKYVLAVYATFSIELLINIATIWFCEKKFSFQNFPDMIFNQHFNTVMIIAIIIGGIEEFFINDQIKKEKTGIPLILVQVLTYIACCILMGVVVASADCIAKSVANSHIILYAFWITFVIFLSTTIGGFLTKRKDYKHPILSRIFIGSFVISIFNMFWGWNWINIIIDVIDLVVVSLFIYLNTVEIKQNAKELLVSKPILKISNVLKDANGIYLEFVFIWGDVADLIARTEAD